MNFTTFKQLSYNEKLEQLAERFRRDVADYHLNGMIRDIEIEVGEDQRVLLYTLILYFYAHSAYDLSRRTVPWRKEEDQVQWTEEIIHHFKKFEPYVFGYGNPSRPTIGLVGLFYEWMKKIHPLDRCLVESDLRTLTRKQAADLLCNQLNSSDAKRKAIREKMGKKEGEEIITEKDIDNAMTRFS